MNILLIVIVAVAIVLFFIGGFVSALNWLIWVALVLAAIAVIAWLVRVIAGRRA